MLLKPSKIVITWSTLLVFLSSAFAGNSFKVEGPVETATGKVVARSGGISECMKLQRSEQCQLLEWAGKPLLSEYFVSINSAIPSQSDPKVIFASTSTGGNACCSQDYLIDFTKSKPIVVEVDALPIPYEGEPTVTLFSEGFTYENFGLGQSPLGEPLWKVYRHKYGTSKVDVLRTLPKYNFTPFEDKKYPYEILDDPVNRAPLLGVTGKQEFLELRNRIQVQTPIARVKENFYVAQGCTAHMCGSEEGIFVLDKEKSTAWAMYTGSINGKTTTKFFGNLGSADTVAKDALEAWMKDKKIRWQSVSFNNDPPVLQSPLVSKPGRTNVPLVAEGGVFKVPVTINKVIPVKFVVDSGAADVAIPADIVAIMMRTGTLTRSDFTGTKTYKLADGSLVPSSTFRIRSLQVGDKYLENIEASMTGVEGQLLLGQSFLKRFQRWSINNGNRTLELD